MRKFVVVLTIPVAFFWRSCSQPTQIAESAIKDFHSAYARRDFAAIYREAHPQLRLSASETEFVQFMKGVSDKLGAFSSAKPSRWDMSANATGTTIATHCDSVFSKAAAVEKFTHMVQGGRALLYSYDVQSKVLLPNTKGVDSEQIERPAMSR